MESKSERPVDWNLLTRYVSGECSEEEEVVVETWAAADTKNRQLLKELQGVWKKVSQWEGTLPIDVDVAWDELNKKIRKAEGDRVREKQRALEGDRPPQRARREHPCTRTSRRRLFAGTVTIAVIAVAALAVFFLGGDPKSGEASKPKLFTTQRGQRAVIQLRDGTDVRLNVDSRLVLPDGGFTKDRRRVRLEGEAFFDVARDTSRPFQVRTENASVEVLGTAFDLKSYPGDRETRVAVAEGEVALKPKQSEEEETALLKKRHLGIVSSRDVREVRREVNLSRELAWTEGKIVFRDAPFSEVVRKLSRWYDLRIEAQVSKEIDKLNATLDGKSPSQTLKAIAAALDLQYKRSGGKVVFYRKEGKPSRYE